MTMELLHLLLASATTAAVGRSLGWASFGLFAITLLFMLACILAARAAKGWDKLGYVAVAVVGSWIGCGSGAVVGFVGLTLQERDNGAGLLGLGLNLLLGGGPWLAFQVKKSRGRRRHTL